MKKEFLSQAKRRQISFSNWYHDDDNGNDDDGNGYGDDDALKRVSFVALVSG